jgi:predicted nucleic acid-binding protein
VAESAVINASPLIFLSRSGHLDLLKAFADTVWVPEPVAKEILARGPDDISAQAIQQTPWLITKPANTIPISVLEWRLGKGESSVLALAIEHGIEAIIDDLHGRKCAASLNISVRGTLGIVLVAKQRGIIPAARPVIEDMMKAGLYLSKKVLDQALAKVDE